MNFVDVEYDMLLFVFINILCVWGIGILFGCFSFEIKLFGSFSVFCVYFVVFVLVQKFDFIKYNVYFYVKINKFKFNVDYFFSRYFILGLLFMFYFMGRLDLYMFSCLYFWEYVDCF